MLCPFKCKTAFSLLWHLGGCLIFLPICVVSCLNSTPTCVFVSVRVRETTTFTRQPVRFESSWLETWSSRNCHHCDLPSRGRRDNESDDAELTSDLLLTGSEKAQSQMMVARALLSWLPCTITTSGSEIIWNQQHRLVSFRIASPAPMARCIGSASTESTPQSSVSSGSAVYSNAGCKHRTCIL